MEFFKNSVGRKILMSITGQLLIIFVIVHMIGNSSIFLGADGINAYAKHLHDLPPLVWIFRLVMLTAVAIHIIYGIQVTLENNKANAKSYAVQNHLKATFASKNMIWTGLLIGAFVIYHLLHFTLHITNPEISAGLAGNFDALQRPDVFKMVVLSFQKGLIALMYAAAMVILFLHLSHGIQSFLQTMGWNNDKTRPVFSTVGKVISGILLVGYVSIPLVILTGLLKL
ncbi:succinate dehydrogenase cytochrome b subunit [Geotalea toluenoxydans]|uniref:succinate dehydrogenase cytochrome b subunit n=1 Tax=Geotalea toluenoxydans TaxID=421624 RepID=UPI0006D0E983|nr:succinate dehydrogenase cytochrome b subunit [Geotalea toluenoxydans]